MATPPRGSKIDENIGSDTSNGDLEAELARLRADVANLTEQLARTGEHSYSAARRAAAEGVEAIRERGEAAAAVLRSNANDVERQVVEYVHEKPLTALAIAAGIGCLFGMMSRR